MSHTITNDFLSFLESSPTSFHATETITNKLKKTGFEELKESALWKLKAGGKYFVTRGGSSLSAFILPKQKVESAIIQASHTDSPSFKLKPNCDFISNNMAMLGVEVYGGPLLTSWLNRDLGIGGEVSFLNGKEEITHELVLFKDHPCTIPQLAIHLDREVNEKGLILNRQEHLAALLGPSTEKEEPYLHRLLKKTLKTKEILGYDLFLFPLEKPRIIGKDLDLISAYRLDNLASAHASLNAISETTSSKNQVKMAIFWDHEEIGSRTALGAESPFLSDTLQRLSSFSHEAFCVFKSQSLCISIDLSHAVHPNYPMKHEPKHPLFLNGGLVIKTNASGKYASSARSSALIALLCKKHKIPLQRFVCRSDIPSGSTVGPATASVSGIRTVDVGLAELSMHSCRELMGAKDHIYLCEFLRAVYHDDSCHIRNL